MRRSSATQPTPSLAPLPAPPSAASSLATLLASFSLVVLALGALAYPTVAISALAGAAIVVVWRPLTDRLSSPLASRRHTPAGGATFGRRRRYRN
jgi:membrane protein implicated in regulation of membrane protease activity